VREIRQVENGRGSLMLDRVELESELFDLLRPRAIRFLDRRGIVTLALRSGDLVARRVLRALQPFDLRNQPPPRRFERRDVFDRLVGIEPAIAEAGADLFDVIANVLGVEHATSATYCTLRFRRAFRPKSRVPRRRSRHPFPAGHQGATQRNAAAGG